MPNVLRRFLAMTARVPIIHVADTAQSPHQARQLSLPANKRHRPHHAPSPPAHTHPVNPTRLHPTPQTGERRHTEQSFGSTLDASQPIGTAVHIGGSARPRNPRPITLRETGAPAPHNPIAGYARLTGEPDMQAAACRWSGLGRSGRSAWARPRP